MESAWAALPELNVVRDKAVAAPEIWEWDGGAFWVGFDEFLLAIH